MISNNVKTAFRLPSGVNKGFTGIWYGSTNNNNTIKKYQPATTKYQAIQIRSFFKIYTGKYLCWSLLLIKFQVFSLQLYQKRDSDTGVFLLNYYEHVFYRTPPDKCFWKSTSFTKTGPNDISKAYYQKGVVFWFLRWTYNRFMEILMKTYSKGFSCSWIFSASWALPNAYLAFPLVN